MADRPGYRTIADRNETLQQGFTGRRRERALQEHFARLKGVEQEAIGNSIVRNTPKDLELAAVRQKYPSMTQGVPLENLDAVWRKLTHDEQNVARITDAKAWDPREFPDQGLAYRPKSIERELQDLNTPSHIGFAPRGRDPIQPGITHTYQPNEQAKALGTVIAAINDPRNSWMGLGPAAGTIRGLGALRNRLFQPIGPEAGGFRVPTSEMYRPLGAVRPNVRKLEVPSTEQGIRSDYLGQVRGMNEEANLLRGPAGGNIGDTHYDPRALTGVIQGQNDLQRMTKIQPLFQSSMEGTPPPEMLRRMGFVNNQSMAELDKIRREAVQWYSGKER
jgi:hypothetical protein